MDSDLKEILASCPIWKRITLGIVASMTATACSMLVPTESASFAVRLNKVVTNEHHTLVVAGIVLAAFFLAFFHLFNSFAIPKAALQLLAQLEVVDKNGFERLQNVLRKHGHIPFWMLESYLSSEQGARNLARQCSAVEVASILDKRLD